MNRKLLLALTILISIPGMFGQTLPGVSPEQKKAVESFLSAHPAVAKLYGPVEKQAIPTINPFENNRKKAVAPPARMAALPEIWGNMVAFGSWTGRYSGYGIYSFFPSHPLEFNMLYKGDNITMNGNGGGVLIGDEYHHINWGIGMYGVEAKYYKYNAKTWERQNYIYGVNPGLIASDLAYDRLKNVCYGAFFTDDLSGYEIGKISFETDTIIKTSIARTPLMVISLGVNSKGELYGICEDGVLYRFNTASGSLTPIGDTGIKVAGNNGIKQMSMAFDQNTDILYWAANDVYGNYSLFTVDTSTGQTNYICELTGRSRLLNLQVMTPAVGNENPGYIMDYAVSFEAPSCAGKVSFTAPSFTYGGDEIKKSLSYEVFVNGQSAASGNVNPGEKVLTDIYATPGLDLIEACVKNEKGHSPMASTQIWVGYDQVPMLEVNYEANGRESAISWKAADKGLHEGVIGDLTFDIVRNPGAVVVAEGLRGNSYVDIIPDDAPMGEYSYTITPDNNGVKGMSMTSMPSMVGSISLPYSQDFEDPSSLSLFRVVDANKDGNTWKWDRSFYTDEGYVVADMYVDDDSDNNEVAFDDWLLTPVFHFEQGVSYIIKFKGRSTAWENQGDRLSIAIGTGMDISKYQLVKSDMALARQFTEYEVNVVSDKEQDIRIGFHRTSLPLTNGMYLDDISIEKAQDPNAPDTATEVSIAPAEKGELKATISFTAPAKNINGDALTSLNKIEIYADGVIVKEIKNLEAGKSYKEEVTLGYHGDHVFAIIPYNDFGAGIPFKDKAYVGHDIPAAPEKVWFEEKEYGLDLRWTPAEKGAKGGYVDASSFTYNIYQSDGKDIYDELATGITETCVPLKYDINDGAQAALALGVRTMNVAGLGAVAISNLFLVGSPYNLPYIDHCLGTEQYGYFGFDNSCFAKGGSSSTSDNDGGLIIWIPSFDKKSSRELESLKIATTGGAAASFMFDYSLGNGDTIDVYSILSNSSEEEIATFTKTSDAEWETAIVDITKFQRNPWFRFKLVLNNKSNLFSLGIDHIRVIESINNDLGVEIEMPKNLKYGQMANIPVFVENKGIKASPAYSVSLLIEDKIIGTANSKGIACGGKEKFVFPAEILPWMTEETIVKAVIDCTVDENPENNIATAKLQFSVNKVSVPENLSGNWNNGVQLSWERPSEFYHFIRFEDFEEYDAWTISNFGDWKLVDVDKAQVETLDEANFPNEG